MHPPLERPEADEPISLTPKSFIGFTLFTAAWVTGATLAINGALAGLLWMGIKDQDPGDGSMAGIGFVAIAFWGVPLAYIIFSLIALARSPEGRGWAACLAVLIGPAVLIGGFAVYSNNQQARKTEAKAVVHSITDTVVGKRNLDSLGAVFPTYGPIVTSSTTMFGCGDVPALRSERSISTSQPDPHALTWIMAAEDILRRLDFNVSTGSYEAIDSRGITQRVELVLIGTRGDDGIVMRGDIEYTNFGRDHVMTVESMNDPCVHTLELTDIDRRFTPGPLPEQIATVGGPG